MFLLYLTTQEDFKKTMDMAFQEICLQKSVQAREKLIYNHRSALQRIEDLEERNKQLVEFIDGDPELRKHNAIEQFKSVLKIYM